MSDLRDLKPEWRNIPTSGTTIQRDNIYKPPLNHVILNTDTGKQEKWDGTAWVPDVVTPLLPPREGAVGRTPTKNWRIKVLSATNGSANANINNIIFDPVNGVGNGSYFDFALPLFTNSDGTTISTVPPVKLVGIVNNYSLGNNMRGVAKDMLRASNVLGSGYIEMTFSVPVDGTSYKMIDAAGSLVRSWDLEASYDNGVTWSVVDSQRSFVRGALAALTPYYGSTTLLGANTFFMDITTNAPAYPANPVEGQRFYNKTSKQDMKFDSATNSWVPVTPTITKWKVVSAAYSAVPDDKLLVDTSVTTVTITLPATPKLGDSVRVGDAAGSFATNNCSVDPGTNTLMGVAAIMTLSVNNVGAEFVFTGSDWRIA